MDETGSHEAVEKPPNMLATYVSVSIVLAVMMVVLFWAAGTIDWRRGWLFFSLFVALTFFAVAWIRRDNPGLFAARRKFQKGTKGWDLVLAPLVMLAFAAILPVAALDDARFKWMPTPEWVPLLGYALLTAGYLGTAWAQSVNPHFEAGVRIQSDRGHTVIDTGPYAYIRHPGYAFSVLMTAGMALSLGSLLALIPTVLAAVMLAIRMLGEEAELRRGLPGYTEYAARVKQRWIPGVW